MATLKLNNVPVITESAGVATVASALVQEGTGINSTGEGGGTKFLREDGDGTSSWQIVGAHTPEGTAVKSTGESGGTKFLREDGDGTSSWQIVGAHTPEGTAVKSTGETGTAKFLRIDGDGTSSWQAAGSPSITDNGNATAMTINSSEQIGIGDTTPAHKLAVLDGTSSEEKDVITWGRADGAATGVIGQDMSISPGHVFIGTENDRPFSIKTHSEKRLTIDGDGHTTPGVDNTQDLGSSSKRWRNIYTTDLHLANDRGNWTVIEEEDYLTLRNNKTNKVYKLVMEEIE